MNNKIFWESIAEIVNHNFTQEGLDTLEKYEELFRTGKYLFKRFTPEEQLGCAAGGSTHVIATILAGTEASTDSESEGISDFKRELKRAAFKEKIIEEWAKRVGVWVTDTDSYLETHFGKPLDEGGEAKVYDNGSFLIKSIGLDYFILPNVALDRITLHNAYFPETALTVLGFGRDSEDNFRIIVQQRFIEGVAISEKEITKYFIGLGFKFDNPRNWTYSTPYIYLSDLHDENVIKSKSGLIYVLDCDIRLNTPELRLGGVREDSNEVIM